MRVSPVALGVLYCLHEACCDYREPSQTVYYAQVLSGVRQFQPPMLPDTGMFMLKSMVSHAAVHGVTSDNQQSGDACAHTVCTT